jgi:sulfur carrier protein ThiS
VLWWLGVGLRTFSFNDSERIETVLKIIYRDQEWELRSGMTTRDAIQKVGLNLEEVLAVRNGKLINEETILEPDDEVTLIAVISGGML